MSPLEERGYQGGERAKRRGGAKRKELKIAEG